MIERTKETMLEKMSEMNRKTTANKEEKNFSVTLFKNAQKIGNKIFLEIPLSLLRVDHAMYQRALQRHVRIIAKNWNDDKCDPLMVNYREDGFFYVIDGQHRLEAAIMRGLDSLVCIVFVGLTIKEEADLFTEQNEGTKKLSPYDTYKANLCRKEEVDMKIHALCTKYGIKVEKNSTPRTLKSVTAARRIIRLSGKEELEWIFKLIEDCKWNNFKESYAADIIMSLGTIHSNHINNLSFARKNLIEFFENSSPKEIISIANAQYPQYGRKVGLNMLLEEIINESTKKSGMSNKVKNIAS